MTHPGFFLVLEGPEGAGKIHPGRGALPSGSAT